jgi:hypothetical protein
MCDFNYTYDEMAVFISEKLPRFQQQIIQDLLNSPNIDEKQIDQIGLKLSGESSDDRMIISVDINRKKDSFWLNVKKEIYKCLCTTSTEYEHEQKMIVNNFEKLVTVLATAIASSLNISTGVITGLITVVLIGITKIGKNAWCATNTYLINPTESEHST